MIRLWPAMNWLWRVPSTPRERQAALIELMKRLNLRPAYHYTQPRKGDPEILRRDLGTAYVAWRRQDGKDISDIVSKRTYTLKIVRRA